MKIKVLVSCSLLCSGVLAGSYTVKNGDTLSEILHKNVEGRIYGEYGHLQKLLSENPGIRNPNYILIGQKVEYTHFSRAVSAEISIEDGPKKKKPRKQAIEVSLMFGSESLNATDISSNANEKAVSNLTYGINLKWTQKWSERYSLFAKAAYNKLDFDVASNKSLKEKSVSKGSVSLGGSYSFSESHQIMISLGLEEMFILSALNIQDLEIKKALIPKIELSAKHLIKETSSGFKISGVWMVGGLQASSQSDYKTKLGQVWSLGVLSELVDKERTYHLGLRYKESSVDTSDLKEKNKEIAIGGGVGFRF